MKRGYSTNGHGWDLPQSQYRPSAAATPTHTAHIASTACTPSPPPLPHLEQLALALLPHDGPSGVLACGDEVGQARGGQAGGGGGSQHALQRSGDHALPGKERQGARWEAARE